MRQERVLEYCLGCSRTCLSFYGGWDRSQSELVGCYMSVKERKFVLLGSGFYYFNWLLCTLTLLLFFLWLFVQCFLYLLYPC